MRSVWESIKDFFQRDWTMAEKILILLCCVMIGIVKGFLLAPIKKGATFCSNNGNRYGQLEDEYWLDDED